MLRNEANKLDPDMCVRGIVRYSRTCSARELPNICADGPTWGNAWRAGSRRREAVAVA
jgi:hypothetical protein